jgi:hypothetical protein
MRKLFFVLQMALLVSGCAHSQNLILSPVGPAPIDKNAMAEKGALVVYSAFDIHADFTSTDAEKRRHTDYTILNEQGEVLQSIRNGSASILEGPVMIFLKPGKYRVRAKAAGYGYVTVPVVLVQGRTTTIHLEGGNSLGNLPESGESLVRLPDGRVVGSSAH